MQVLDTTHQHVITRYFTPACQYYLLHTSMSVLDTSHQHVSTRYFIPACQY